MQIQIDPAGHLSRQWIDMQMTEKPIGNNSVQDQVRMLTQFIGYLVALGDEKKLGTLTSRKLHCRHEVTITGNQYDYLNLLLQSQRCDIEPYTHVDTFLMDVGLQILCLDRHLLKIGRQSARIQFPTPKSKLSHT